MILGVLIFSSWRKKLLVPPIFFIDLLYIWSWLLVVLNFELLNFFTSIYLLIDDLKFNISVSLCNGISWPQIVGTYGLCFSFHLVVCMLLMPKAFDCTWYLKNTELDKGGQLLLAHLWFGWNSCAFSWPTLFSLLLYWEKKECFYFGSFFQKLVRWQWLLSSHLSDRFASIIISYWKL